MLQKIEEYMKKNGMLENTRGVVLGLSGGADSVCLFLILAHLAGKKNFMLEAVHVNHGIRGSEGAQDEAFCRRLCRKCGIKLRVFREDVCSIAIREKMSQEEAGRKVRYAAFSKAAKALARKAQIKEEQVKTAVAHHMEDQAETVLFHLFRGGRLGGMSGMRPVQGDVIRPLLCARRSEIEAFLRNENQAFCIDSTNESDNYTRNIIRKHILSVAREQVNQKAVENICKTAAHMQELQAHVREETSELAARCVTWRARRAVVDLARLEGAPPFLRRALFHELLCECVGTGKDVGSVHVDALEKLSQGRTGKRISLPCGVEAFREYDRMWIGRPAAGEAESWEMTCEPAESGGGETPKNQEAEKNTETTCTKIIDCAKIKNGLSIRCRRPGDFIVVGRQGEKKSVSRYFIDEKVPKEERERIPIVFDGQEAVWIVGRRLSGRYQPGPDTACRLRVTVCRRQGDDHAKDTGVN